MKEKDVVADFDKIANQEISDLRTQPVKPPIIKELPHAARTREEEDVPKPYRDLLIAYILVTVLGILAMNIAWEYRFWRSSHKMDQAIERLEQFFPSHK